MSRLHRIELLIFLACWFAFAYFNQGGGWNQNSRFSEIRAMVEEGRFAIDDFMVYRPVGEHPVEEGTEKEAMHMVCSSGDVAYVPHTGHFHPNKPPGTSFMALPAYWIIYHLERAMGVNPDHWWPLTINAWL